MLFTDFTVIRITIRFKISNSFLKKYMEISFFLVKSLIYNLSKYFKLKYK